jgi:hypothetical protein
VIFIKSTCIYSTQQLKITKIVPFEKINAKLVYAKRKESKETAALVNTIAVEVATCFLKELSNPKKARSNYLVR